MYSAQDEKKRPLWLESLPCDAITQHSHEYQSTTGKSINGYLVQGEKEGKVGQAGRQAGRRWVASSAIQLTIRRIAAQRNTKYL